ncbi:DUF1617 family protein [Atopococcus tabaci]|uniref:DUF1617 family protein n=1 Tax=Atopococcus tabaci TaxID=269774 RepID=UPI00240A135C|nr:DUF1617 family protein [Atopococcus tabaci]
MKTIKLKNNEVVPVFNFLQELELVGQASRGRTKFNKRLEEKNKEFNEDLTEIRKDYFEVDEAGELVVKDNKFQPKEDMTDEQKKELKDRVKELEEEEVEVSFSEYSKKYEALFEALDKLDVPLKGQDAFAYDQLMTAYEENEEEK